MYMTFGSGKFNEEKNRKERRELQSSEWLFEIED